MAGNDVHPDDMADDRLDAFFGDLRSAAETTPAPRPGDELATLFLTGAAPVTAPGTGARRRWSMRAAVAGAVAGVTFGGLGIAGALPNPVQHGVAGVVRHVGVQLPDPETTTTTAPVPARKTVPTPATTSPRGVDGGDDRGTSTTEPGDDRGGSNRGPGAGGDDGSGSGDDNRGPGNAQDRTATTTVTRDGDGRSGRGSSGDSGRRDDGKGRNSSGSSDVHPDEDGSQAADAQSTSGGHLE